MIANPIKETETNCAGIDYVVRKIDWYGNLSSHLLKRRDPSGNSYAGLQLGQNYPPLQGTPLLPDEKCLRILLE